MTASRVCPVHGVPDASELNAWPCPDSCMYFLAELERRVEDVQINGNFTRITTQDGVMVRQEFRDHQPFGDPRPVPKRGPWLDWNDKNRENS